MNTSNSFTIQSSNPISHRHKTHSEVPNADVTRVKSKSCIIKNEEAKQKQIYSVLSEGGVIAQLRRLNKIQERNAMLKG